MVYIKQISIRKSSTRIVTYIILYINIYRIHLIIYNWHGLTYKLSSSNSTSTEYLYYVDLTY